MTRSIDSLEPLHTDQLLTVTGAESAWQVMKALPAALSAPVSQTYDTTKAFIKNHEFFHQGLMNVPIGGGKHFRNVPFIGPGRMALGALGGNPREVAAGYETTRGTWDAE